MNQGYAWFHAKEGAEKMGGFLKEFRISCQNAKKTQLSHEKKPWLVRWLGCIGDELLLSYIGIIMSHYKDPY